MSSVTPGMVLFLGSVLFLFAMMNAEFLI
jgi:hypothetical protein